MSGRAMDGESQRGLKKMKPLSLAPLSLGGDQLEPGDAMIDAMIDKLLHFGADASASPAGARAGARPGRAAPLARAGDAAGRRPLRPRQGGRRGDLAARRRCAAPGSQGRVPRGARARAGIGPEFRHRVGAALGLIFWVHMHLLRNCLERARAALGAARDRRGAASSAPTRAQAHAPRDRRARGGRGRARVIPARARSLRSEGPARRAMVALV